MKSLEALVVAGELTMPRKVIREVKDYGHPDVPGVWVEAMEALIKHPLDVDLHFVQEVMQAAPKVVESTATSDVADPYVAGLALQLRLAGFEVTVVTEDRIDRLPHKLSLATACELLKIRWMQLADLLAEVKPG